MTRINTPVTPAIKHRQQRLLNRSKTLRKNNIAALMYICELSYYYKIIKRHVL